MAEIKSLETINNERDIIIKNKIVKDILQPKFEAQFGKDLHIQQIHIFDSVDPYNIHSDVDSGGKFLPGHVHAWTFIIPLFEKLNFPRCIFFSSFDAIKPSKPMTIEAAIILYVKDQPFISANIKANDVAKMIASLQPNW